jgi:hypothetical protein
LMTLALVILALVGLAILKCFFKAGKPPFPCT